VANPLFLKCRKYLLAGITACAFLCLLTSCKALHSTEQDVRVRLYGQVVDQNGKPLPDVKISASVRHWLQPEIMAFAAGARFIRIIAKTDKTGRFKLSGASGDTLSIEHVEKENYQLEPGLQSFAPASGTRDLPVVFKMWPANMHEHLITEQKSFHIATDGRLYFIDLTKGSIGEQGAGDLKLWIKIPEQVAPGQKHDWISEIQLINGGLLEETNASSAMYLAPQEGYAPIFRCEQQVRSNQRASTGTRRFYVKLDDRRKYGRITIELVAPYNDRVPGMVHLEYAINPSSSRVLRP
jgi:hypothetical protein